MTFRQIEIELVSIESSMLVPYEGASSRPAEKKDLGRKHENLFLRKKSPPMPQHVEKLAVFGIPIFEYGSLQGGKNV